VPSRASAQPRRNALTAADCIIPQRKGSGRDARRAQLSKNNRDPRRRIAVAMWTYVYISEQVAVFKMRLVQIEQTRLGGDLVARRRAVLLQWSEELVSARAEFPISACRPFPPAADAKERRRTMSRSVECASGREISRARNGPVQHRGWLPDS
jgi:hypothetical protein